MTRGNNRLFSFHAGIKHFLTSGGGRSSLSDVSGASRLTSNDVVGSMGQHLFLNEVGVAHVRR